MLLTVLGSNGAYPTAGRPAAGYLVSAGGAALWMDAGPGTFMALCGEIDPGELSGVFLSHRHPDHCADIFALYHALAYSPDGRAGKVRPIPLLCPADLAEALERFVDGSPSWRAVFDVVTLSDGGAASVGPLRISAARTNHPPPTFSPRIEAEGKVLTYTADTGPSGEVAAVRSEAETARRGHLDAVAASIGGRDLAGLSVVVDGANGAASAVGPECLRRLGASVRELNTSPDGRNINEGCGSTCPEGLQAAVVESGAGAGVAFDGDADRVVAVDGAGNLVDGDQIIAVCALDRWRRGALPGPGVVVTVMANGGLRSALAAEGIEVIETAVGDRHVLEMLDRRGLVLGGEQSGHVIFRDLATTGDGLLTAVQLLDALKRSGRDLASLAAAAMTRRPQVLAEVRLEAPVGGLEARLAPAAAAAAERLAGAGRVLVRPSGTEPVVRIMVEADDQAAARAEADRLASEIAAALS